MLRLARGLKPHSALLEIAHRPWLPLVVSLRAVKQG